MVKYAKGTRLKFLPRLIILLIILGTIFVTAYYTGLTRKYCGADLSCFTEKAHACRSVEVYATQNNNIYHYKVYPKPTANCILVITLDKVQEGTPPEHKELLKGKSMKCIVPKSQMKTLNINELNNIMTYCTGPLKESLYELIIKRMYELIISNLGEIAEQAENIMKV